MTAIGESCRLVSHHLNEALTNNGLSIQQCQIILVGNAATDYFENIFSQMALAYPVKKVLEKEKNLMLDRLLSLVKKANYEVSNLFSKRIVDPSYSSENNAIHTPSPSDKRKVRIMIADIKAKLRGSDVKGAYAIYDELRFWLEQNSFPDWDVELENVIKGVDRVVKKTSLSEEKQRPVLNPNSEYPKKSPVVDLKKLRRELHREMADIKALLRIGRKDDAVVALEKLEVRLQHDNIHEFDSGLADIRKEYGLNEGVIIKEEKPAVSAKKAMSSAEKLLQKGQFAEAKRKFASEEGNSEMAQVCSKLIRAKRNIASYVSGIDSVRRSHNVTSKQNAIKELENSLALYRQYGLETIDIEQLIEQYKTI